MTTVHVSKASAGFQRPRLLYVVTSSMSVSLLTGQLRYLRGAGFDVTVVSSPGEVLNAAAECEGVQTFAVPIARQIAPLQDLLSLWLLWRLFRRFRPTITNVGTPKAGLLGGLAAWLAGVPCRFYTLRGLRCETTVGFKQRVLRFFDRISCLCAHRVLCVSESLRRKAVLMGIVEAERSVVLGCGSSNGVDVGRFAATAESVHRAASLRKGLNIPAGAPIVGFVGRLTRDKGIPELIEACSELRRRLTGLRLLLVGDFEEGDPLPADVRHTIRTDPHIVCPGFVRDSVPYFHLMDVFALPTHREGFPNAILEANAASKGVVAARATGTTDAVIDGVTGILVPAGNAMHLALALESLLENTALAVALGRAGRERVLREFRQELVWERIAQEYLRLLHEKGLPLPAATNEPMNTAVVSNLEAMA